MHGGANHPGARADRRGKGNGTANDGEGKRHCWPRGDHVCGDELTQPHCGVESFGREVGQLRTCGNLHFARDRKMRPAAPVGPAHCARHSEAQQVGRKLCELTRGPACGDEFLEGGPCARKIVRWLRLGLHARRTNEERAPMRDSSARAA
jgi:hypothetical protein